MSESALAMALGDESPPGTEFPASDDNGQADRVRNDGFFAGAVGLLRNLLATALATELWGTAFSGAFPRHPFLRQKLQNINVDLVGGSDGTAFTESPATAFTAQLTAVVETTNSFRDRNRTFLKLNAFSFKIGHDLSPPFNRGLEYFGLMPTLKGTEIATLAISYVHALGVWTHTSFMTESPPFQIL